VVSRIKMHIYNCENLDILDYAVKVNMAKFQFHWSYPFEHHKTFAN
jgi:hypothetical protein